MATNLLTVIVINVSSVVHDSKANQIPWKRGYKIQKWDCSWKESTRPHFKKSLTIENDCEQSHFSIKLNSEMGDRYRPHSMLYRYRPHSMLSYALRRKFTWWQWALYAGARHVKLMLYTLSYRRYFKFYFSDFGKLYRARL